MSSFQVNYYKHMQNMHPNSFYTLQSHHHASEVCKEPMFLLATLIFTTLFYYVLAFIQALPFQT